jgi:hypothetical protein
LEGTATGSYVPGWPDVTSDQNLRWVENHGILLPVDGRVFTAAAQALIEAGKFERGLARRLPGVLPKGASVLEIGSAVGFLGLHLTTVRPDLTYAMQEENLSLRSTMQRIMTKNERMFNKSLSLWQTSLGEAPGNTVMLLVAEAKPDALLLADPQLTPGVLIDLLPRLRNEQPRQIVLYGRLLELHQADITSVAEVLAKLGYQPGLGFDPNVARGFVRVDG